MQTAVFTRARFAGLALLSLMMAAASSAQQMTPYAANSQPTYSRAEQEADSLVSLSPDKIVSLLTTEPGLLLECKKLLVKTAYGQGRVLSAADLTDEAVLRLVRQDQQTRVLLTQEILDRGYIQAKPTKEEIARRQQLAANNPQALALESAVPAQAGMNQEDSFWALQQRQLQRGTTGGYEQDYPATLPGQQVPTTPRQNVPLIDNRRSLERAKLENSTGDFPTGLPLDAIGLTPASSGAAGSSALLSARLGDQSSLGGGPQADALSTAAGLNAPLSQSTANPSTPRSGGTRSATSSDLSAPSPMASVSVPQNPAGVRPPSSLSSQPFLSRQPNPYADVPSLYDLYAQYSKRAPYLQRFGLDVFRNGSGNFEQLPMDLPAGPDYVLGSGDGLSIDLWGGISERLRRVVDREGKISLPEVGNVQVAGRTLGDVQQMVQSAMRTQLRNIQVDVSLTRLRTIRVYVVGDVQNPGAYDVSSLSTPLNALLAAGGPTDGGSLRLIKHSREQKVIENVDIYDLLLHGVHAGTQRLESGDTILVPPLGPTVTVQGMVRRPAIYELNGEKDLAQVLELAGGVLSTGNLSHIDVERLVAHQSRTMIAVDLPEDGKTTSAANLESIPIQDGDRINISPIISFADKTVYLDGHVSRPGKYAYTDGMKVSDLIKSYKDLLPEPYEAHAEVIRLKAPDYTPQVIAFNLGDAMKGGDQDMALQPLDTVRVFGRFDFQDAPVVTVTGAVREPGDHVTNGATYLRDAIFLAGNTTGDAQMDDVQIFRMQGGQLRVLSANLSKALAGDDKENILLEPKDRVFVHHSLTHSDPPQVTVEGEVQRPGTYPLGNGMTAAELVRVAGGLQRSAYTAEADLTQYMVEHGQKIVADHQEVPIARAMAGDPDTDVRLHDGDVLTIRQLSGWKDRGATISVSGEVAHPGSYGIQPGEHLSSVLARAGGLLPGAYPYGTILQRMQVRELEELNHSQLVRQVQQEGVGLKAVDDPISKESAVLQWKSTLEKLENTPPTGRLIIHMSTNVKSWANTPADIEVRAGDTLYIPRKPNFVMVDGAVYNPTAVTFKPGKNVGWYLRQAGGPSNVANKRATFVVRADGSVIGGGSAGLFSGGIEDAQLQAGDTVVVPDKAYGGGLTWRNTLQAAQIVSAAGIAIQVARGF